MNVNMNDEEMEFSLRSDYIVGGLKEKKQERG